MKSRRERKQIELLESLESRVLLSVVTPRAKPKQAPPTPPTVSKIVITQQPKSNIKAGAIALMTIKLEDSSGNVVTSAKDKVSLQIVTGPSSGNLFGTLTVNAVNGVATFNAFSFGKIGTYKLKAVDGNISSPSTQAVNVALGPAAKVKIYSTFPTNAQKVPSGAVGPVVVDVVDWGGNIVNTATTLKFNTVSSSSGSNGWVAAGTFVVGETVTQANSGATGVVTAVATGVNGSVSVNVLGGVFDVTDVVTGNTSKATLTPSGTPTFGTTNSSTVNVVLNTTLNTATVPGTVSQVASGSATTINGVATVNLTGTSGTTSGTTSSSNTTNTPASLGLKPGYYSMIVTDGTLVSQTLQIYVR
ncbi:MAG TPA: hypothetical protein VM008_17820 [Phycisphaerae bacterium]|nr:hypothetical protein [Phycisphaerae bacterium]